MAKEQIVGGAEKRVGTKDRRGGINGGAEATGGSWEDISERRSVKNTRRGGVRAGTAGESAGEKVGTKGKRAGLNDRRGGITTGNGVNAGSAWADISERRSAITSRRGGTDIGDGSGVKITKNQWLILEGIAENPHVTAVELSDLVGISTRKIETNLQKLKAKGLLERVGARKNGYWAIKKAHGS